MFRSRTSRLSSVLALVACLGAQLAGAVHSASVRHVACAEHGGVVELHADVDAPVAPQHATQALRAMHDESHHSDCELCATFSAVARRHTPVVRTRSPSFALPRRSHEVPQPTRTLFLLAPKGSPPRLAIA
jgi:hypothetical protein